MTTIEFTIDADGIIEPGHREATTSDEVRFTGASKTVYVFLSGGSHSSGLFGTTPVSAPGTYAIDASNDYVISTDPEWTPLIPGLEGQATNASINVGSSSSEDQDDQGEDEP